MRRVICALTVLALASPAFAADLDLDILRGSQPVGPATFTRWSGFYVGGQFGYTNGNAPFSTATPPGIGNALRETTLENEFNVSQWPTLGTANQTVPSFGGFVGYNTQWQDVVIGIEANVSRAAFSLQAPSTPIGPLFLGADSLGLTHTVTISSSGSLSGNDFGTLRARRLRVRQLHAPRIRRTGTDRGNRVRCLKRPRHSVQFRHAAGVRVFFLQQRLQRQCANLVWSRGRRRRRLGANAEHFPARRIRVGCVQRAAGPVVHACHRPRRRRLQVLKTDDRQWTTDDGRRIGDDQRLSSVVNRAPGVVHYST
jgi:hypothetical protein